MESTTDQAQDSISFSEFYSMQEIENIMAITDPDFLYSMYVEPKLKDMKAKYPTLSGVHFAVAIWDSVQQAHYMNKQVDEIHEMEDRKRGVIND